MPRSIRSTPRSGRLLSCAALASAAFSLWAATTPEVRLKVDRAETGTVTLAWPLLPGSVLETRPALSPGSPWVESPVTPAIVGGSNVVTVVPGETGQFYRLRMPATREPTRLVELSPAPGEGGVAVNRETIVHFSRPLAAEIHPAPGAFEVSLGDRRMLSRVEIGADRRSATLFVLEPLPASSRVQVVFDGTAFRDTDGQAVDADSDGTPGGVGRWEFDTAAIQGVAGTAVVGRVFASEVRSGTNQPLAGVTITVDGAEESLRTVTDAEGRFRLEPSPAGRFFVHVDGRTAVGSEWPSGAYYPFVGKAWEAVVGRTNNLASGTGELFLPRIAAGALQSLSPVVDSVVSFPAETLATHPELAGVQLAVPANALFSDSGLRGGRVGLAPVAPDRLPEPLPPGLNLPLVITIQTDGAMNFDRPVPVRFPNLPDPATGVTLPPGARTAIWSFNHDTGRWEVAGPAVVSADGRFAESLPGTGIRQPGWHGAAPGTSPTEPGGGAPTPDTSQSPQDAEDDCDANRVVLDTALDLLDCGASLAGVSRWTDAVMNFGQNMANLMETSEEMAEATSTPGFSCERASALFGQLNAVGHTLADLVSPVIATGDPTGYAAAATGCLVDGARNVARLSCAGHCEAGTTSGRRCGEMNELIEDSMALREIVEADSAVEAAITAAELAGDRMSSAYRAHCREGGGSANGLNGAALQAGGTEAELRARAADLRDRYRALGLVAGAAATAGRAFTTQFQGYQDRLFSVFSGWMMEDRTWAGAFYRLSAPSFSYRRRVGSSGDFTLPILAPGVGYTLEVCLPARGLFAQADFVSAQAGDRTVVPIPVLRPIGDRERFPDTDGDGLPDLVEAVVGSRADLRDTDGDGRSDGVEVAAGEDPRGGGAPVEGVVATIPTGGPATKVLELGESLVGVVNADGPLVFFDTSNPAAPVRIGSVGSGGGGMHVAARFPWLATAGNDSLLRLFDISNPRAPVQRWSVLASLRGEVLAVGATAVYVRSDTEFAVLDLADGRRLWGDTDRLADHLVWLGDSLAALGRNATNLSVLQPGADRFEELSSLPISPALDFPVAPRLRMAGDAGVVAGVGGFSVFSFTNRRAVALVDAFRDSAAVMLDAAFVDSGTLGVIIRSASRGTQVGIYNVAPAAGTPRVITAYDTPGEPRTLIQHQGYLYVADDEAGLTVIAVQPDRGEDSGPGSRPPSVSLSGSFTRPDAQEEEAPFTLTATSLGGRLSRVDFYLGTQRLGTTRFPFRWSDTAPVLSTASSNLTFTARAFTAGGLSSTSAPIAIRLVTETTPPRVLSQSPAPFSTSPLGTVRSLSLNLTEPLDHASLGIDLLTLSEAGPDTVLGTGDDVTVALTGFAYTPGGRVLRFDRSEPLPPGHYQARLHPTFRDLRGNLAAATVVWPFIVQREVRWNSDLDGAFGDASRWDGGVAPDYRDLAIVDRTGADPVVTVSGEEVFIGGLVSREPFVARAGIYAGQDLVFEGSLSVPNRALLSAQGFLRTRGPTTWSGTGVANVEVSGFFHSGALLVNLPGGGLLVRSPGAAAPLFVNESAGTVELQGGTALRTDSFRTDAQIINAGMLESVAPAGVTNRVATRAFENRGRIHATSGVLELANLQSLGPLTVDAGARISISGSTTDFEPAAQVGGDGDVSFDLTSSEVSRVSSSIEIGGRLITTGPLAGLVFRGNRTSASLFDAIGRAEFRGLGADFGTLLLRDATILVASGTPLRLGALSCGDRPFGGRGGTLRLESPVQVAGPAGISVLTVNGSNTLSFSGPVTVSNVLSVLEEARVEFGTSLTCVPSSLVLVSETASLRIRAGADIALPQGSPIRLAGVLVNDGLLRTADGLAGQAEIFGNGPRKIVNRGVLEARSGRLLVPSIAQTSGFLRLVGGTLDAEAVLLEGGDLEGEGDLLGPVQVTGGTLSPGGNAIGAIRLGIGSFGRSGYTQAGAGRLLLDLASVASHDRLEVQDAELGGVLDVRLAPGFVPVMDDEFVVVQGSNLTGTFAETRLPALPVGRRFLVRYDPTSVRLRVVAGP